MEHCYWVMLGLEAATSLVLLCTPRFMLGEGRSTADPAGVLAWLLCCLCVGGTVRLAALWLQMQWLPGPMPNACLGYGCECIVCTSSASTVALQSHHCLLSCKACLDVLLLVSCRCHCGPVTRLWSGLSHSVDWHQRGCSSIVIWTHTLKTTSLVIRAFQQHPWPTVRHHSACSTFSRRAGIAERQIASRLDSKATNCAWSYDLLMLLGVCGAVQYVCRAWEGRQWVHKPVETSSVLCHSYLLADWSINWHAAKQQVL